MTDERNDLATLFADCWKDEALRQRFLSNPKEVLAERGFAIPENLDVAVVENSDNCVHITLPAAPPDAANLSDMELTVAAGGAGGSGYTDACMASCLQPSCGQQAPCPASTPGSPGCPP